MFVVRPKRVLAKYVRSVEMASIMGRCQGVNAMVMHINMMSHNVPNTFHPPPGLPPPECLKARFLQR